MFSKTRIEFSEKRGIALPFANHFSVWPKRSPVSAFNLLCYVNFLEVSEENPASQR